MAHYDPRALQDAAGKLMSLREQFEQVLGQFGGLDGGSPFGALDSGGRAGRALRAFQDEVRAELSSAVDHLGQGAGQLRSTATGVEDTDTGNAQAIEHAGQGL